MPEKVIDAKENIFRTARKLGESETASLATLPSHIKLVAYSLEFSGIGGMSKAVIIDAGGGRGELGRISEKLRNEGKDITCINVDYSIKELLKGKGDRVLGDISDLPLKDNSADAVFLISYSPDMEYLLKAVENYQITRNDFLEKTQLIQNLSDIINWQDRVTTLEAVRVLKKGGKLITAGDFDFRILINQIAGREPSGALQLTKKNIFKIADGGEENTKAVSVYEKMKEVEIGKMIAEAKEQLKSLVDSLEIYEVKGGLLWRMRKEGKI